MIRFIQIELLKSKGDKKMDDLSAAFILHEQNVALLSKHSLSGEVFNTSTGNKHGSSVKRADTALAKVDGLKNIDAEIIFQKE